MMKKILLIIYFFIINLFVDLTMKAEEMPWSPRTRRFSFDYELIPLIDIRYSGNVTALLAQTAFLNCRIHNLGNHSVSWIRHRDIHLLTVGRYTYTSDQRFRVSHEQDSEDWSLKISDAQERDSGVYECQISTTPPTSYFIFLKIARPTVKILGGSDIHVNSGSTINLTCVVQFFPEPPEYVSWIHNGKPINYNSTRGGITVILERDDVTTSSLLIQNAGRRDSGIYKCGPVTAALANISVHVLSGGEHPAAMQQGGQNTDSSSCVRNILLCFLFSSLFMPY